MEYWASGEFKAMYRLKEALWVNARFYIIVGVVGGVGGFLFARISDLSLKNLQALVIGLSNSYVLLLGPGIVELPVSLWKSRDLHMRLDTLYEKINPRARQLDENVTNYQCEVASIYCNLKEIQRILQSAKKSPRILSLTDDMMHSLPSSELIDYERYSAVIDKSEWIQLDLLKCVEMTDKQVLTLLSKVEFTIRDEL
ncbi:hypothetical protein JH06_3943 [Blastocystis sp. subtype 4]|uniref:hypothetical protein n=1 Tax=Blastocystis sp. subtype 4 TaxID=944170 RepID=UPI000711A12E|nr:hypothetical protein JH06_3943 [Blastocystis sp. subtype 4]KNB42536.1 hypothetical protein JH06_3943 [Blastocystis sp. subtype 4]|eukprot:XP_014525979.1 hypothetical protein JH06_3943 [Blastocystis sp. subtype 4]